MEHVDQTIPVDELAAIAVDVAQEAAAHVRRRRPELFGATPALNPVSTKSTVSPVSTKSTETDPVTVADTETERLIRQLLHQARPDDEVLGEEHGGSRAVPSGVRWVVDPIDGTVNFMYGVPAYAVSLAAQVDGRSVAGVVVDVAREVVYGAALGGGAWVADGDGDRVPLRCNPVDRAELALVATGFGYAADRRRAQGRIVAELLPKVRDIRRIGAAALDLCMVASGAVDAHYEHGLSPWDWAAGGLIAAEAGAVVVTPPPDSRADEGHITVAVAPGIADEFLGLLDEVGAREPLV
ncbi:inositol monophosphatase family protein [Gordonia alkanivorans]|uniref:inositol monophosphatase family protein n=1 Tax=Gordonia alkanivorans TaxID=84096 RepID=UPI000FDEF374|nr:inositol monophosphatase family protein [Gordonia alkanivorans]AZZ82041.1 inositol monophosphatase [Gordonia alkanivorans]MDH3009792.1 inositol monophosphatase family protein [Gordonia alkanivorans]MDH3048389.1 inositol monophosphatase family protein [Gordonia alkanivorans]